jgi:hypothetical protein
MKQQVFSKTVLSLTSLFIQFNLLFAQSPAITNVDGTPLTTRYCWTDSNYAIAGNPAGGTFSGCGINEANGQWYFNPVLASQGISVFPYQCSITYTTADGSASTTQNILVWKPVVITPPLQDSLPAMVPFI